MNSPDWATFTRRTEDPKLAWLERELDKREIPHKRDGRSFHAPILKVPKGNLDAAWEILAPLDDVNDDDPQFRERE